MKRLNPAVQVKLLEKENRELREWNWQLKGFTLQQALDMAIITLNRSFGFGPERNRKFGNDFMETFREYAKACVADGQDDEEIVYTKSLVDRALMAAMGEIIPFDERYAPENLYFRDSLDKGVDERAKEEPPKGVDDRDGSDQIQPGTAGSGGGV